MSKFTFIFLFSIVTLTACNQKESSEIQLDKTTIESCRGKTIELMLPKNRVNSEQHYYTEGFIQRYSYVDNSYIALLCGGNADLDISDKQADKFSRIEVINGIIIIYENVHSNYKEVFDKAFDLMKEEGVSGNY